MDDESETSWGPQPTRPLKRKASQLSPPDEVDDGHIASKRAPLFSHLLDRIVKWLTELPPSWGHIANPSDSFAIGKMSKDQDGGADSSLRPGSTPPAANNSQSYPLPSQPLDVIPASSIPLLRPSTRTPVPVSAPSSELSILSLGTSATTTPSRKGLKDLKRVQTPSYRKELSKHSIYIDPYGKSMPAPIRSFAQNVIGKRRASPDLTDAEVANNQKQLAALDNADEAATRAGFASTSLFPKSRTTKAKTIITLLKSVPIYHSIQPLSPITPALDIRQLPHPRLTSIMVIHLRALMIPKPV